MKINIFAEDSGTTQEETDIPFKQYYQGGFLPIANLANQLNEYGDVQLHILSEQFGLVRGEEKVGEYLRQDQSESGVEEEALRTVAESTTDSDIMVILLSASRFSSLVKNNWDRITDRAKPDSIWCLGAARSSLTPIDFDPLQQKGCEIVLYERVGVARLSNETREELLEQVRQRQSE